jgi:sugar (pentulose or hexulose) kinase
LPQLLAPGEVVGQILPSIATQYRINPECLICAGTTDSIAAFAAAGANQPGQAVTSLKPGERFPINDPNLLPRLEPRPDRDRDFLHGMLTGLARIEAQGYQLLQELGTDRLTQIYTAGGGAQKSTWQTIRQNLIGVPIVLASQQDAAYGAALLALNGGFSDR